MKLTDAKGQRWAFMQKFIIPDIAEPEKDYLVRWRLIQTPWFGIYLHKILMIDNDVNLHDHPWNFKAFILCGSYTEEWLEEPIFNSQNIEVLINPHPIQRTWDRWSSHSMKTKSFHKITKLWRVPTWSLLFVGRRKRDWGYLTQDNNWVARKDYDWQKYNGI